MECLDEETIEALVTGFLAGDARADAATHLDQCPACRESVRKTAIVYRALDRVFAEETREDCPSGEELARYDEGTVEAGDKHRIEKHLKTCVRCAADLYYLTKQRQALEAEESQQAHGDQSSRASEAIAIVLTAAAQNPSIASWARQSVQKVCRFPDPVVLESLSPLAQREQRLAAATGKGFDRQILDTGDSPFQLEMIRFGNEVRLALSAKQQAAEYANCIIQLTLFEGQDRRLERVIPITNGQGGCVLSEGEVSACIPQAQSLVATIQVLDADQMLRGAGEAGVVDALIGLLAHGDPPARRSAVELLAAGGAAQAADAIAALQNDADETVRKAAAAALQRLSGN